MTKVLSECPECHAIVHASVEPPTPMQHVDGCPFAVDRRACAWCGGPMAARPRENAECCQPVCRVTRWRWDNRRLPKGYAPKRPTRGRSSRTNGTRRASRSGRQIAFGRAVEAVTALLRAHTAATPETARELAEFHLTGALPPRQRTGRRS